MASLAGAIAAACAALAPTLRAARTATDSPSPTSSAAPTRPPVPTAAASPTEASPAAAAVCARDTAGRVLFVDTHVHLDGRTRSGADYDGAADASLANDDASGTTIEIVMAEPFPDGWSGVYDYPAYEAACKRRRSRMAFLGGGGTLNPMIQQAIAAGSLSGDLESRFRSADRPSSSEGPSTAYGVPPCLLRRHEVSVRAAEPAGATLDKRPE